MASVTWNWINSIPQPAATTFDFPSDGFYGDQYSLQATRLLSYFFAHKFLLFIVSGAVPCAAVPVQQTDVGPVPVVSHQTWFLCVPFNLPQQSNFEICCGYVLGNLASCILISLVPIKLSETPRDLTTQPNSEIDCFLRNLENVDSQFKLWKWLFLEKPLYFTAWGPNQTLRLAAS